MAVTKHKKGRVSRFREVLSQQRAAEAKETVQRSRERIAESKKLIQSTKELMAGSRARKHLKD